VIAEALASDGPALALTVCVEAAIVAALSFPLRLKVLQAVLASVAVNLVTQPTLWVLMSSAMFRTPTLWWPALAVGETIVWLVEAGAYLLLLADLRRKPWALAKALALSLAANAASAALGLALGV
jgi:hypothetical protein